MTQNEKAYDLLQKGRGLLEEGHPAQAAMVLEKAKKLQPRKGSILEGLGQAYYRIGEFEKARDQFQAAVEVDPTNDYAQFCLGLSLARLGRLDEARGHYRLAIAMKPDQDDYLNMAHVFEEDD